MQHNNDYFKSINRWQSQRVATLTSPDGFLTLVGLPWLKEGQNNMGSASNNDALFPEYLPPKIGMIEVGAEGIYLTIEPGVSAMIADTAVTHTQLLTDADPSGPTIIHMGSVSWFVIKRGDALGIRIRDSQSKRRLEFKEVGRFPLNEAWVVEGTFQPYEEPRLVPIPTILGTQEEMVSPGTVALTIHGKEIKLVALKSQNPEQLFLIIADETSGKETYGGGRFLMSEPVDENGRVIVDFNKATNPPCAFSPYATCPRPPAENRLAFPIQAGEKVYQDPFSEVH